MTAGQADIYACGGGVQYDQNLNGESGKSFTTATTAQTSTVPSVPPAFQTIHVFHHHFQTLSCYNCYQNGFTSLSPKDSSPPCCCCVDHHCCTSHHIAPSSHHQSDSGCEFTPRNSFSSSASNSSATSPRGILKCQSSILKNQTNSEKQKKKSGYYWLEESDHCEWAPPSARKRVHFDLDNLEIISTSNMLQIHPATNDDKIDNHFNGEMRRNSDASLMASRMSLSGLKLSGNSSSNGNQEDQTPKDLFVLLPNGTSVVIETFTPESTFSEIKDVSLLFLLL